ncbi:MAG: hypothetical protein GY862_39675 [Gammaproteobacteria bacterium]|nr:hypothetical protein [Gammaproteobacteria bacterium]
MSHEKLLIIESDWTKGNGTQSTQTRSSAKLYASVENLVSGGNPIVCSVIKPFLTTAYLKDIEYFVKLPANRKGPNVIIISSHGFYDRTDCREGHIVAAIDAQIDLGNEIRFLAALLKRTVFILDACHIGVDLASFRAASGALGVIGFQKEVNWTASSAFVLALLRRYVYEGVFGMRRSSPVKPLNVLKSMQQDGYGSLMAQLGVAYEFR